jgi:hypothetical protein
LQSQFSLFLCILKPEAYAQKLDRSKTPAQLHIMNWHPDPSITSNHGIGGLPRPEPFLQSSCESLSLQGPRMTSMDFHAPRCEPSGKSICVDRWWWLVVTTDPPMIIGGDWWLLIEVDVVQLSITFPWCWISVEVKQFQAYCFRAGLWYWCCRTGICSDRGKGRGPAMVAEG